MMVDSAIEIKKWMTIFHPSDERYLSIQPTIEHKYSIQQNIKMEMMTDPVSINDPTRYYVCFYQLNKKYAIKITNPHKDCKLDILFISESE
jgi:hypothetical protein